MRSSDQNKMASYNANMRRVETAIQFQFRSLLVIQFLLSLCFLQYVRTAPVEDQSVEQLMNTLARCGPPAPEFYTYELRVTEHSPKQTMFEAACLRRLQLKDTELDPNDYVENVRRTLCNKFVQLVYNHCVKEPDTKSQYQTLQSGWFAYEKNPSTQNLCSGVNRLMDLTPDYCHNVCDEDLEFRSICLASSFMVDEMPRLLLREKGK